MIKAGTLDAQENPLANTVTYGVHKFHKFHTLTYHFYISRPIFLHRAAFDAWPDDLRRAMQAAVAEAVAFQRKLAVEEHDAVAQDHRGRRLRDRGTERGGTCRLCRRRGAARRRRPQNVWRRDVQDGAEALAAVIPLPLLITGLSPGDPRSMNAVLHSSGDGRVKPGHDAEQIA